jgi:Flp pilus assembly protein TadD
VRLSPNAPIKHRNLGDAYARLGEPERARLAYGRAVELCEEQLRTNAQDARTLSMLGVYEAKLGRITRARAHADEAVSFGPQMADVVYRRAVVLALADRPGDAVATLEQALRLGYSASAARADEDLALLHDRSDFKRMVGESATIAMKGEAK